MDKAASDIILEFLQRCSEPVVQGMLTKGGGKFWFTPPSHPEVASILTNFCQHPTWPFRMTSVQHGAVLTEVAMEPPTTDWFQPSLVRIDLAADQLFNLGDVDVLYAIKTSGGDDNRPSVLVNSTDRVHYLSSEVFAFPIVTDQIRYTTLSFDKPVTLYACKTSTGDKIKGVRLCTIRMFGVTWTIDKNGYIIPAVNSLAAIQEQPRVPEVKAPVLVPEEKWEVVSETPAPTADASTETDTAEPETKTATVAVATTSATPIAAPTTEAEKLRLWYTMGIALMDLRDGDTVFVVSGALEGDTTVVKATLVGDIQWSKQFNATFTVRLVDAPMLSVTMLGGAGYPIGRPLLLPVSTRADAITLVESRGFKVSDTARLMTAVVVDRTAQQEQELGLVDMDPLHPLEKWRIWATATVNLFHLEKGETVFVRTGDSDGPCALLEAIVERGVEWNLEHDEDDYTTGYITVRLVETQCITVRMQFIADYFKYEYPRIFPYHCRAAALRLAKSRNLVIGPKAALMFPGDSVVSVTPTQV